MPQKPSWAVEGETIHYHLKGDGSRMFTTGKIVRVLPGALEIQKSRRREKESTDLWIQRNLRDARRMKLFWSRILCCLQNLFGVTISQHL
jgi:hypothetical protein